MYLQEDDKVGGFVSPSTSLPTNACSYITDADEIFLVGVDWVTVK